MNAIIIFHTDKLIIHIVGKPMAKYMIPVYKGV